MRIAFISLHFAEYSLRLAKALAEHGNKVLLILQKENLKNEIGSYLSEFSNPNLKISAISHKKLRNPLFLSNVFQTCKTVFSFKPRLIHFQETLKDYEFLSFMILKQKYPVILTVHDHIDHSGRDSQKKKRFLLYRRIMRSYADAIIVHSKAIKEEVQNLSEFKNKKIYVVPHGPLGFFPKDNKIDLDKFEKGSLLFFGRVEKYKGLKYLIEAHEVLRSKGIHHKIVVAGRGTDLNNYKNVLQKNPYFEIKDYYISAEEIPYLFLNSHIIVLPYTDATQSGVLMMAMNYGRPVVASKVGAIPEVVQTASCGLLVPPRDPYSLSSAIETLIRDIRFSSQLGRNAKKFIKNELSWGKIAILTQKIYEKFNKRNEK